MPQAVGVFVEATGDGSTMERGNRLGETRGTKVDGLFTCETWKRHGGSFAGGSEMEAPDEWMECYYYVFFGRLLWSFFALVF